MIIAALFAGSVSAYSMDQRQDEAQGRLQIVNHLWVQIKPFIFEFEKKDYKRASSLLTSLVSITKEKNPAEAAYATVLLGELHFEGGHGMKQNNDLAEGYFNTALNQSFDSTARAWAGYRIAFMESRKPACQRSDSLIDRHLKTVIKEDKSPWVTAQAKILSGFFYYKHTDPKYNKHNQAVTYFEQVIRENVHAESVLFAHYYLGIIFDEGQNGTPVNDKKAYEHYSIAAQGDDSFEAALDARVNACVMHCNGRVPQKHAPHIEEYLSSLERQNHYPDYKRYARLCRQQLSKK